MGEKQNNPSVHNNGTVKKQKKVLNPFIRNLLISGIMLLTAIITLSVWLKCRPDNKSNTHDLFNIEMVSELTTIECRYHNVAVRDVEGGFGGIGKKYVWFEYDVIVDVGIDINEVRIDDPTTDGVVKIYLPPAKILRAAVDKATISKPVCDLGLFTELTADEELQIINEGKESLTSDAKTQEVIYQAHNSAKYILEQYVINIGKLLGEEYTVEWIKVPDHIQVAPDVSSTAE